MWAGAIGNFQHCGTTLTHERARVVVARLL
jgi:hypothetical protein